LKVFKFGGASVKDAESIRNVLHLLQVVGTENILLVVSAMGKTTNALEVVVKNYFENGEQLEAAVQEVKSYHHAIAGRLFEESHAVFEDLGRLYNELDYFLKQNRSSNYNFVYDQVVSYGELLSTTMVSHFLMQNQLPAIWLDARNVLKTDSQYRDANVNWDATQKLISTHVTGKAIHVVQGFIGSDENSFTTTLGREGSDYTAAIFAYCLQAESVTIWKDVPGVMNADPRYFEQAQLLVQISYREAIELAFYGASVIHPKTLQPLQKKEIPLFVKSFTNPELPGTKVCNGVDLVPHMPCYIVKKGQLLVSVSSLDFSFIMEEQISEIFGLLHKMKMKVHLIQNTAISFSVCVEDKFGHFPDFFASLQHQFKVAYNENVSLYTIRHFTPEAIAVVEKDKTILLKQISRETMQLVAKE
jgi:aspartate kinase